MLQQYRNFAPTCFDHHIEVGGLEDWLVGPTQTRDSGPLDRSNFQTALEMLGGEGENVQVHRFGHWGPGWFEIILVAPDTTEAQTLESIRDSLEDHPVLSDWHYSKLETQECDEYWESYQWREAIKQIRNDFGFHEDGAVHHCLENHTTALLDLLSPDIHHDSNQCYYDIHRAVDGLERSELARFLWRVRHGDE